MLLLSSQGMGQDDQRFHKVKGLPTNEVYDLLLDKTGLLWIGHDFGLSSFDGKTFRHYSCPDQTALAIAGLQMDSLGHIWCYNFNGQIFEVADGRMRWLKEYDNRSEYSYPRMAIYKNELIVSTIRGFFMYDYIKRKGRYLDFKLKDDAVLTLAIAGTKIVGQSRFSWLVSDSAKLKRYLYPQWFKRYNETGRTTLLQSGRDSLLYYICNPRAICIRMRVEDNGMTVVDSCRVPYFINGVCFTDKGWWVNTKKDSYCISSRDTIKGLNLSDIVYDREGNQWVSSLSKGLLVRYAHPMKELKTDLPMMQAGDFVRAILPVSNKVILGTNGGDILIKDFASGEVKVLAKNKVMGAIEHLYNWGNNTVLVCPSVGIYGLSLNSLSLKLLAHTSVVKDVAVNDHCAAFAMMTGVKLSAPKIENKIDTTGCSKAADKYGLSSLQLDEEGFLQLSHQRSRAVCFLPFKDGMLAAHKNGVQEIDKHGTKAVLYKGHPISATAFLPYKKKVFLATLQDGLLVYDKNGVRSTGENPSLFTSKIIKLKYINHRVWILGIKGVQTIDPDTEQMLGAHELPAISPGDITDLDMVNGKIWLASSEGIWELDDTVYNAYKPQAFISYAVSSRGDTLSADNVSVGYGQGGIKFYMDAPWYGNPDALYIGYRLLGASDTSWQYTSSTDQPVSFQSLSSGNYEFQYKVFYTIGNYSGPVNSYRFWVSRTWWQQWWVWASVAVLLLAVTGYYMRVWHRFRLKRQRMYYEKELALEKERHRIGADIHDELGATLSGIKLMTEMAQRKYDRSSAIDADLNNIHGSVSLLSKKIREVIWSLSSSYDTLESLLNYLHIRGVELFTHSSIAFRSELPNDIPYIEIKSESRRQIYLVVKEAMHNALKHSRASAVEMRCSLTLSHLYIVVEDNGSGFDLHALKHSNGLKNMKQRVSDLQGQLHINCGAKGTAVQISIPLPKR